MNSKSEKISSISNQIVKLSHDELLMNLRFLDTALYLLELKPEGRNMQHVYTGTSLLYDERKLLGEYKKHTNSCKRLYLHTLFHCVFGHPFDSEGRNRKIWDLATDIAVENVILDFSLNILSLPTDDILKNRIQILKKELRRVNGGTATLTAQKIYRYFCIEELSEDG